MEFKKNITKHYNKKSLQEKRRYLQNNMTPAEKKIWTFLRKRQTGHRFLRQYSVDRYIMDFYCPSRKIAIEIDGDIHNEKSVKEHDEVRQKYLEQFGIIFC